MDFEGVVATATKLGVEESWLRKGRWRSTGIIEREKLEEMLDCVGLRLHDLYPDALDSQELEADGFCGRCHEIVTPIEGVCPWCEGTVEDSSGHERAYCAVCDAMTSPRAGRCCWRCGTRHTHVPWEPCACGCERLVHRYDRHLRPKIHSARRTTARETVGSWRWSTATTAWRLIPCSRARAAIGSTDGASRSARTRPASSTSTRTTRAR